MKRMPPKPNPTNALDLMRRGAFNGDLDAMMNELRKWLNRGAQPLKISSWEHLRCLCLLCEWHEYHGRYSDASTEIKRAAPQIEQQMAEWLQNGGPPPWKENTVLGQQQIWVLLHYALTLFRTDHWGRANTLLDRCEELIQEGALSANSLLSRIKYSKGRIARDQRKTELARDLYGEAIRYEYKRLEGHTPRATVDLGAHQQAYSNYTIAKCLGLGLGYISLRAGQLKRAEATIGAARTLLRTTDGEILKAYTDYLYASTLRCRCNEGDLASAEDLLSQVIKTFKNLGHKGYQLKALLEQAKVYHLQAVLSQLPGAIQQGLKNVEEIRDNTAVKDRVRIEALVLESRLTLASADKRQLQPQDARSSEARATELAEVTRKASEELGAQGESINPSPLIALAEIKLAFATGPSDKRLPDATKLLDTAMELGLSNPLTVAVVTLHLARVAAKQEQYGRATDLFSNWKSKYASEIEHGFIVKYLAPAVEREVFRFRADDFSIREGEKNYYKIDHRLRRWLLEQTFRTLGEKEFRANGHTHLGISRATMFKWRAELKFDPPRKHIPDAD